MGAPTPKGPAAGMVPPFEPQQAAPAQEQRPPSPCAAAIQRQQVVHPDQQAAFEEALSMAKQNKINIVEYYPNQKFIQYVKSPKDIDWAQPLHKQLWPQLTARRTEAEFRVLRQKIPGPLP